MSEAAGLESGLGPTAAIITIGDEIVEGRVLNENAKWLSDELMTRGGWPRLVVAVPDVSSLIVPVVRIAADAADVLFLTGGLGFTPDDITRHAVATAFYRDLQVANHAAVAHRSGWGHSDLCHISIERTAPRFLGHVTDDGDGAVRAV